MAVSGGITPLIKIAHLAEAFRMKCEIHHGGNSLNNVANLHVMMAVNNSDYYEVFPCSGANKYALVEDAEVDNQGWSMPRLSRDWVTRSTGTWWSAKR